MNFTQAQQWGETSRPMVPPRGPERPLRGASGAPARRRRLPSRHPIVAGVCRLPRHPIVLVHGFLAFDAFGTGRLSRRYFRGIREFLEGLGCSVYVLSLPAAAAVSVRAAELVRQVNEIREAHVNIVAHSMGGLDARYAVAELGLAGRAAAVITLGTPHRGTPIADLVEPGAALVTGEGLHDLTTSRAAEFNAKVHDVRSVFYGSIVGASSSVQSCLSGGYEYLRRIVGPNDGVVPSESQQWGNVLGEVDADHLAQIGWSRRFDTRPLYGALMRQLAGIGC